MSVVVRCASGAHRVRLDRQRFWAPARCPRCKTPVDRVRVRRVIAWVVARYQASGRTVSQRVTWALAWVSPLVALGLWLFLWGFGDRWWPATLLLFGPRWLLLVPLAVLFAATALVRPRALLPVLLASAILLGPVLGYRVGVRSWLVTGERSDDIRVMTLNAEGGLNFTPSSVPALLAVDADVIAVQECGRRLADLEQRLSDWSRHAVGPLCLFSRFPLEQVDQQERENVARAGGSGWVVRYAIRAPAGLFFLTNVHLETPRKGLEAVRDGRVFEGGRHLASKSLIRDVESRRARRWVDEQGDPFLVVGDFNMPVESVIYRRYWGDMVNAFSVAGLGFGSTRYNGWIRVRIDHILMGPGWQVVRAFVGPDIGSDHRPMIADLRRRNGV